MAKENKQSALKMGLASAGALGGLYYAFTKKKSFWGYVGFFILGSIAGQLLGNAIESVTKKSKPSNPNLPSGSTLPSSSTNTTPKTSDSSNLTKKQKVDLVVNNLKTIEPATIDGETNLRGFLGKLPDSELNVWVSLSKGFTDAEIIRLGQSGNQAEAYKIFQSKYGLSQKQIEELMTKLLGSVLV
jgi:hypothetical protein